MGNFDRYTTILARVLMSAIFLISGCLKAAHWSGTVGMLASKGLPAASLLLPVLLLVELGGGICLLLGIQPRIVGWILFLYLIPVSVTIHNFWAYQGADQSGQMIHFLKNLAIMGGLLFATTGERAASAPPAAR